MLTGKYLAGCRRKSVKITDKRVRIMNEILNSVKLIKMYAWEASFAKSTGEHCYCLLISVPLATHGIE